MNKYLSKIISTLGYTIQYGCIAHCVFEHVGDFVVCSGPSMEPTLLSNNILFTEHISPKMKLLSKGDIVIAKCPTNPKQFICKRIIGLPGDLIERSDLFGSTYTELVPRGHVWLEGDNYKNSSDSRKYGPVPLGLIRSRAICRVWPLQDITYLKSRLSAWDS